MQTTSSYHHSHDPSSYAYVNEAGPSRPTRFRPCQRYYGHKAEQTGTKRFRRSDVSRNRLPRSSWAADFFSPPPSSSTEQKHPTNVEADAQSRASSPLSSPPFSPLVFSDEDDSSTLPPRATQPRSSLSPPSSPESPPDERRKRDCIASPIPAPCSSSRPLQPSSTSSHPPSSIFDTNDPLVDPSCSHRSHFSPPTSVIQASPPYKRKRSRIESDGPTQPTLSATGPPRSATPPALAEASLQESPALQRAQRRRRQPNRSPVILTRLGARQDIDVQPELTYIKPPTLPSTTLQPRQHQTKVDPSPKVFPPRQRETTPPPSSVREDLLAASQARPVPPREHPGRSAAHAKERTSTRPKFQHSSGNVTDLGAVFGDDAVDCDEIRKKALFLGEESEEDDVVYELLNGRTRRRRRMQEAKEQPCTLSPDEITRFFTSANMRPSKKAPSSVESSPLSKYSARQNRLDPQSNPRRRLLPMRRSYSLPAPNDLPAKSSYLRRKKEEGTPTREIKCVKVRRQAILAQRLAQKQKEAAEPTLTGQKGSLTAKGAAVVTQKTATRPPVPLSGATTTRAGPISCSDPAYRNLNPQLAQMARRIRKSLVQ